MIVKKYYVHLKGITVKKGSRIQFSSVNLKGSTVHYSTNVLADSFIEKVALSYIREEFPGQFDSKMC